MNYASYLKGDGLFLCLAKSRAGINDAGILCSISKKMNRQYILYDFYYEGREGGGGGVHNPISHQKFFQNPSPSWIFIKNPSRSYQNPSE